MQDDAKKRCVLIEHSIGTPVGYTSGVLRCAALAHPSINARYDIQCRALSSDEYPFETQGTVHNRKDNALLCEILALAPDVVGLSVFSWNISFFSRFTKMLRLMAPECKIIWGGKLPTNDFRRLAVENPSVDCFCIGEGELVLQNYLLSLLDGEPPREPLPGTYMLVNGTYRRGGSGPLPALGSLPNPYVLRLIDSSVTTTAYIETLRGCVYHCTFCDWGGKSYRTYDDDYICDVVRACLEQRFNIIFFMDSIFAVEPERRKRFLRVALDHYNGHSKFGFEVFVEHLDEESRELLGELSDRDAIVKIEIGLQSGSEKTLRTIKRPHRRERFTERYNALVNRRPHLQSRIQMDLIIGLPGDTWQSYGAGLNTLFSMNPGLISTFPLEIFPGSEMQETQMQEHGLVALDVPPYCLISTTTMSAFEIQTLMCLSWVFCSVREILRESLFYLHHALHENLFGFIEEFRHWCVSTGRVSSWFTYGTLQRHIVNLVAFASETLDTRLPATHATRVKQLLLYELAPFIVLHDSREELAALWHHPTREAPLKDVIAPNSPDTSRFFVLSDFVTYPSHPTSNQVALGAIGQASIISVEIRGRSFRRQILDWSSAVSALAAADDRSIYVACGADAVWQQLVGSMMDELPVTQDV